VDVLVHLVTEVVAAEVAVALAVAEVALVEEIVVAKAIVVVLLGKSYLN
jgi:hypothetical protein